MADDASSSSSFAGNIIDSSINQDELIMKQQREIEKEISESIPLVGELEPLSSLEKEYYEDPVYLLKVKDLSAKYKQIRRTRPDGNCFFRAFSYAYLEQLLTDKNEYEKFYEIAKNSKEILVALGFSQFTVEDFYETVSLRYELPPPPAGRLGEPAAWAESVDNSHAQLSHQAIRVLNLELQLQYGTEAWKSYLNTLQNLVLKSQNTHGGLRKQIAAVNWERKRSQTASGARLRALRRRWAQLVSDNYRTERAIMQLETQLQKAKGERPAIDDGEPADLESVKDLPDKLNSESEKEVQKKIEDMFAD